ncbi:MAG: gamma-glutamyltransferase, partial [Pseudomonadales bacterium]
AEQDAARRLFLHPEGRPWVAGDRFRQPVLAQTLRRLAEAGAEDFYRGAIAKAIAEDMAANGGWITAEDLAAFPEPAIVEPLRATYRGYEIATLPPPFGGWVLLQLMKVLEQMPLEPRQQEGAPRQLQLLEAMRLAHGTRARDPVPSFTNYEEDVAKKISEAEAARLWSEKGETTHFSVVDDAGWVVAVTQSIDSYFGAKVAHPTLGFLYNNYMQGFRLEDDGSPYVLKPREMVLSSMTGTIVSEADQPLLVLGSPGSERIISAVAQVTSHWLDLSRNLKEAVGAYRVHGTPKNAAFIEGPALSQALLAGLVRAGFSLERPRYGVSDSYLDPYFGGVHTIAWEGGRWVGAADPRRDGAVRTVENTR